MSKNQARLSLEQKWRRRKGTAIIETAVGICVLIPVLFLLLDIVALVVGQTINDDLAKSAARYATQEANKADGEAAANKYLDGTLYTGPTGLVSDAKISQFTWDDQVNDRVTVTTQVIINLPIPVPFGGPSSQSMQAQFSEKLLNIPLRIPGNAGAAAS